jgi:uncharacterized membrane protein YedE/YeeE
MTGGLNWWLVGGGLAVGVVFGMLAQYQRLCMVAATSNVMLIKDYRQVLGFAATLLIAIGGTRLSEFMGWVAIQDSSYRNAQFDWLGVIVGGLIFGVGATLAGGCAVRTVVRSAEGSLQAIVALIFFALFAAFTQYGFLEPLRLDLTAATAVTMGSGVSLADVLRLPFWLPTVVVLLLLLAMVVRLYPRHRGGSFILVGLAIGALVVLSWWITGVFAQDEFFPKPPSGITMSGPLARIGFMVTTGAVPEFSFIIAFIIGVVAGAFVLALLTGRFKFQLAQFSMLIYAAVGGSLMGIGAIEAYGCNVGQGLTGISTLSIESILAVLGMIGGIMLGTKFWAARIERG